MNNMGPLITFQKTNPAWRFPRVAPHRLKPKPPTTDTSPPVRQVEEYRRRVTCVYSTYTVWKEAAHVNSSSSFFLNKPPTNYLTKSDNRKKRKKKPINTQGFSSTTTMCFCFCGRFWWRRRVGVGENRETFQTARQTPIIGVS